MDPKTKNLIKYLTINMVLPLVSFFVLIRVLNVTDYVWLLGFVVIAIIVWRSLLSIYRRMILPAKKPLEFGKWAVVTGSTSGIGKVFADYLASKGMSVLIISRTESRLQEQCKEINTLYGVQTKYLAFDYTKVGPEKKEFYSRLDQVLKELHEDGGVGLLINNVGAANPYPKGIVEFSDEEVDDMINCNIMSTIGMTRAVVKYMTEKRNGCVVSISSGSGNFPAPFIALYSATKAFMTQFTRSLKVEHWDSGVEFLVVTPFYVVSNLYKRKKGTLLAPMPIKLVEGTMAQLGKKYIWQGHGYWFHGLIGNLGAYFWNSTARYRKSMLDNRRRYDEKQAEIASKEEQSK